MTIFGLKTKFWFIGFFQRRVEHYLNVNISGIKLSIKPPFSVQIMLYARKYHRELILGGKCDIAPGHKNKQYIYQLAECIHLKPFQATKTHLVDSISVHSNIKQHTVLPTERVIVYFLPKSYIAKLSIYHYKSFHISPLVCVHCDSYI